MELFGSEQILISLFGGILVSIVLGLSGTMVVHNKIAFFSDALGHCTFTGVALGHLLGIKNYEFSILLFSILFSFLISNLIEKSKSSADTVISVFSSAGLSLGIFILTLNSSLSNYSDFFVGDILSITKKDILGIFGLLVFVILFWIFMFNKFLISSLNKDLAVSKLINYKFYRTSFIVLIAIVISFAIRWVGILLINSLLTLPAAASKNISKSMKQYLFLSILFSILSGFFGFIISYFAGSSSAPVIVLFATLLYFISHMINKKIN